MKSDLEWLVDRLSLILSCGASQKDTLEMIRTLTATINLELGRGKVDA
jgi:hypothetical protein